MCGGVAGDMCILSLIEESRRRRWIAVLGLAVCAALILMKFVPSIPGHFTIYEYMALAAWIAIGLATRRGGSQQ